MPSPVFEPGNKHGKGGKRKGAGRKSAKELKAILKAVNKAQARLVDSVSLIEARYVHMAVDGKHERTTIHAMENYIKPVSHEQQPTAIIHQFIQFSNNQNTVQLPAEGVSAPILVSDGRGQEEGGEVLAQEIRQGHDGLEFHSFTHVSGKRGT